jgi:hypothetical protein
MNFDQAPAAFPEEAARQSPKLAPFHIETTSYKMINGTGIPVHIFIPKDLPVGT